MERIGDFRRSLEEMVRSHSELAKDWQSLESMRKRARNGAKKKREEEKRRRRKERREKIEERRLLLLVKWRRFDDKVDFVLFFSFF